MGTSGAGNAANFIAGGSESMTSPSVPSYPETCRAGHPWATSAYIKPNGHRFCKVCCELRRREKGILKRGTLYQESMLPPEEKLNVRLDKSPGHGPKGECWVYTRAKNGSGYGRIWVDGKLVQAHRFSYETAFGPIPDGLDVCHKCDFPPCCRPDHLFTGTAADNSADMVAKGRSADMKAVSLYRQNPVGERNGMARLTWDRVRGIREQYRNGGISQSALGRQYGVAGSAICLIVNNKSWKEYPIEPVNAN